MAGARIQLKRATAAQWSAANPVLYSGEIGLETDTNKFKIGDGSTAFNSLSYFNGNLTGSSLNDLADVTITSASNGDFLRWNGTAWVNDAVNLSVDTVGSYVESLVAGTGVTLTNNSGEAATPTIAIGQSVATNASVTFNSVSANVTGNLTGNVTGNADTATTLATARTISLSGDVSGSVSFNGSANVDIAATIQPNSVALGADTTGNYVNDVTAGTGVTVTHTPGEGSSPTIAIGQAVATTDNPTFAGATLDAVRIGITAAGEIDTTTGNLTIDSAGGTVTVDDNLTVTGNLTISGTTTTVNTETVTINDNIIVLNSNSTADPSENAGIEVERGDLTNVALRWNETNDKWEITNDGTTYGVVAQLGSIALGTDTTGNYMSDVTAGTGISVTHTAGEGSSASVSLNASLDNLTDAAIATPLLSQSLVYDGTNWVNQYAPVATYARNAEATALSVGEVVYLFGAAGDRASVKRASNSAESTSSKTVGVVSVGGNAGSDVTIVTTGYVSGINLGAYTAGDVLWLGSTAGTFTTTKPSAPNHLVFIGVVARANGGNGILYVKCQNGYELDELHDVAITSATSGDFLKWNGTTWVNDPINLGTDTTGDYVQNLTAGTGVTLANNSGEGSSPTIAIGQSVATNATVTFTAVNANLTGNVTGNADTATTLATSRTIELTGDVTGSASFNGSANATIAATIAANSVALGTDTTGNYVQNLVAGTGITLTNNTGESATPTIAVTANTYEAYGAVSSHEADTTNIHGIADTSTLVTLTGTQTLTNKTLTSPTITGVSPVVTLAGDLTGSVTLTDLGSGTLTATIAANSVALGTDTTGSYVQSLVAGNNITLTNNSGEGATPTINSGMTISDTIPSSPTNGQVWYESDTGKTFVYYDSFWVEIVGSTGAQGTAGANGLIQDFGYQTGTNYTSMLTSVTQTNLSQSRTYYSPIYITGTRSFDRILLRTGTLFSGTGTVRLGVYNNSGGKPSTVLFDAGTVSTTASGTTYTITISQTIDSGWYWLAFNSQTNATTSNYVTSISIVYPTLQKYTAAFDTYQANWYEEGVTGAFATAGSVSSISGVPVVGLRAL